VLLGAFVSLVFFISQRDFLGGKTSLSKATRAFERVEIHNTPEGIKYISSETFLGSIYGLGVAHARDRLWQMHFFNRLAKGTVSELLGNRSLDLDISFRNIGIERAARDMLSRISPEGRAVLEAYSAGVNDMLDSMELLPIEFYILWAPRM
jgi:penicillin amidase